MRSSNATPEDKARNTLIMLEHPILIEPFEPRSTELALQRDYRLRSSIWARFGDVLTLLCYFISLNPSFETHASQANFSLPNTLKTRLNPSSLREFQEKMFWAFHMGLSRETQVGRHQASKQVVESEGDDTKGEHAIIATAASTCDCWMQSRLRLRSSRSRSMDGFMCVTTWLFWRWRNENTFQTDLSHRDNPIHTIFQTVREFWFTTTTLHHARLVKGRQEDEWVRWIPPIPDEWARWIPPIPGYVQFN